MLLRRYLQQTVWLSRRECFRLLTEKKISVNNVVVSDFSFDFSVWDSVFIDGIDWFPLIIDGSPSQSDTIAFHKPVGYAVSTHDTHNTTIYDILPPEFLHYRYIGRLDKDSRGLLLLTNDLDLVHRLSHPSFHSEKVYMVTLDRAFIVFDMQQCLQGVWEWDDILAVDAIAVMDNPHTIRIVLHEGKNRHIRRMLAVLWYGVRDLCRVAQAGIELWDLPVGEWRNIEI